MVQGAKIFCDGIFEYLTFQNFETSEGRINHGLPCRSCCLVVDRLDDLSLIRSQEIDTFLMMQELRNASRASFSCRKVEIYGRIIH